MADLLLAHGSYFAIILALVLIGSGFPVPEEVPVVTAGVLSGHGQLNPWLALASCLVGAMAGDSIMYWIGYQFGRSVIREHRWWARFVKPEREAKIEQMIEHHGLKVLFLTRFLVGMRTPFYLAAGVLRVPFRRFIVMDLFCATTVIGLFFGLSYFFGPTVAQWIRGAEVWLTVVVVLVVAVVVGSVYWRRRRRERAQAESQATQLPAEEPGPSEPPPSLPSEQSERPVGKVERVA